MTPSIPLWRGALTLTVLATLAACGGGGGGGGSPNPDPPNPPGSSNRTIGGTVTGLSGAGLVLQNNGGDNLTIAANGAFTFATSISNGNAYAVTALSQPTNPSQTCAVTSGSGTASANVTTVAVACTTDTFNLSATVSGLTGTGLVLGNNADSKTVDSNATFAFTPVASGARYNVVVESAPNSAERCTVANGAGVIGAADVAVAVTCVATAPTYAFGLNKGDSTLTSYVVDGGTGQLRPRLSAKTGDSPATTLTYKTANGGQFSYVLNTGSDNISAFAVNARSGVIDEVTGSPFATAGDAPTLLVLHPKLPVIYATNEGGASITAFTINASTGALTSLGAVATGTTPRSFNIDASGRFAYVAAPGSSELFTYAIDQTSGALSEVASSRVAIDPSFGGLALARSGNYLYVFNPAPGWIAPFAINAATGAPTALAGEPIAAGTYINYLGMHPNGRFIYAKRGTQLRDEANGIVVFALNAATGALTEIAGSPFDVGANPLQIVIDPRGRRLYASHVLVSPTQLQVRAYSIDTDSGALSVIPGSPFANSQSPESLAIDSTGKFLYTSNTSSDVLTAYSISAADGSLSQLASSPVSAGDQPSFVAVNEDTAPLTVSSKFIYATDALTNIVKSFAIAADGTLTFGADAAAAGPLGVTLDPKGRYAYAASTTTGNIHIYSVASQTGALTEISGSPVAGGSDAYYVSIEPSGRYAYVSSRTDNVIMKYAIDGSTGLLSSPTPTNVGGAVDQLLVTPNGRWLLANVAGGRDLHRYRIDTSNGDLVDHASISVGIAGDVVGSLAVDPSGKYAFVTRSTGADGVLSSYQINTQSGALASANDFSFTGTAPKGVAADSSGKLVFVADEVGNQVDMFQVQANGTLVPLDAVTISDPIGVTTDYSGKFVYVTTTGGDLHTLSIDRDANTLSLIDTDNAGAAVAPGTIVTSSHTE